MGVKMANTANMIEVVRRCINPLLNETLFLSIFAVLSAVNCGTVQACVYACKRYKEKITKESRKHKEY
jgi:hypothetical protein